MLMPVSQSHSGHFNGFSYKFRQSDGYMQSEEKKLQNYAEVFAHTQGVPS